ncbi:MAG: ATP-binding protein [Bacteroides sp.]|nr:ATP-binding protein [Bacteroides sp.]MCM1549418.1 ATP-binding protein [Clostridium sp.]
MSKPKINHTLIEYILAQPSFADFKNSSSSDDIIKFMDEMPGGFLIYHADGNQNIIYANQALLRIYQCDTLDEFREMTGNSFRGMIHPEDLDAVELSIEKQIASSQYDLDYVEYRIIRKDGGVRWIEDYGHFFHSETAGDIFYVFLVDATEKRKQILSERNLLIQEKEQKIQNLIEEYDKERKLIHQEQLRRLEVIEGLSINYESILYADLDTNQLLPYRLSGRTERQFEKKFQVLDFTWYTTDYINTWVHPEDRERVRSSTTPAYIRKKLSQTETYYINYRVLNQDEIQHLQLRIVNVGNDAHISQIVMGYRRIDEEVLREMEQKQVLEEALHNANLAIVAKNTFLSNMSHDMRTPLNAIFGFTTLAKNHSKHPAALLDYLDKIEAAGGQLLDLIDKVLEISWAEAKDIQITEAQCNLHDIIQDVHKSLLPMAEKKHITFSLNDSEVEHFNIYSDSGKLRQILLYLTDNAITYTPDKGRVDIIIKEEEALPNDHARYQFIVKDTGIGISHDFLKHIFEPFEREKNTTFSGIHGTGLGLTITRNIVEKMGGTIDVHSIPGQGSTFTVLLHLHIQNHPFTTAIDKEAIMEQIKQKKILLVEDNEINLEIETEILQELGFCIEAAANGSIAVEKIKTSRPGEYAFVLMDIQMPVMNGWQAAAAIRHLEHPALSHIPIIALSANAFENDAKMSIENGMDAHLTKPIDIPLLLDTAVQVVQTHQDLYGTTP